MIYPSAEMLAYQQEQMEGTFTLTTTAYMPTESITGGLEEYGTVVIDVEQVSLEEVPVNVQQGNITVADLRFLSMSPDVPVTKGWQFRSAVATYNVLAETTDDSDPSHTEVIAEKVA